MKFDKVNPKSRSLRFAQLATVFAFGLSSSACGMLDLPDDIEDMVKPGKPGKPEKPEKPKEDKVHWDYVVGGDMGPDVWGDLSPKFATCKTGLEQSPINIENATQAKGMPRIKINYSPAPYDAIDNGHTVQVNFPAGRMMKVGGKKFELLQFHYHTGSEHTIDGKRYPLELHLVHKTKEGTLGVLGVMVEAGEANPTLQTILDHLPDPGKTRVEPKLQLNPAGILPNTLTYFGYDGSLTTPPCSEGVKWHVLNTPITASQAQLDAFDDIYGITYRPVQPLNGRKIHSNCVH